MGRTNIALQRGDLELAQTEAEEAVSISREIDVPEWLAHALVNLGHAKQTEDSSASAGAYLESLSICREIGAKECACTAFDGLAALEAAAGEIRSAVMLLAASQSSRASAGIEMDSQPYEADLHERTTAAARRVLAEREFRDVAAAGARLSFEEAIEYALGLGATTESRRRPQLRTTRS
jgi:hypothetical protein